MLEKRCEMLTKNNSKIYVDPNGHASFDGAKYLAIIMKQKKWLNLD